MCMLREKAVLLHKSSNVEAVDIMLLDFSVPFRLSLNFTEER